MISIVGFNTLKNSGQINKVYKKQAKHTAEFVVFYHQNEQKNVAFVAGKKVGNAVFRNKAKRLLRAHFIKYSHQLKNGSYVFVAKAKLLESNYKITQRNFYGALQKLNALQTTT